MKIKLENIIPDPDQPRKTFDMEKIVELRGSTESLGLIQPITVRPCDGGKYMVIVGERRFRAAQLDGAKTIECLVREDVDDKVAREMQFAENSQQESVPDNELGLGFRAYCDLYKCSMSELARRVGLSRSFIEERVAIVTKLSPNLHNVEAKPLTFTEKRELTAIPDYRRQEEVARPFQEGNVPSSSAQEIVRIAMKQPDRAVDSIVAEVVGRGVNRYHREEKEKDRQQRVEERLILPVSNSQGIRVILGDVNNWQDLDVGAGSVDSIITDPPYNHEFLPTFVALSSFANYILKDGGSLFAMVGQSYLPDVMSMLSKSLTYHWMLAYLTPGGQSAQLWDRNVNSFWKPVLWFTKGKYVGKWLGDVAKSDVNDNDKDFHNWGQSESGMADLIRRTTEEGDLILDPFCGGGTTGKVAVELGRGFIGVDNSQEAVDLTKRRLGLI